MSLLTVFATTLQQAYSTCSASLFNSSLSRPISDPLPAFQSEAESVWSRTGAECVDGSNPRASGAFAGLWTFTPESGPLPVGSVLEVHTCRSVASFDLVLALGTCQQSCLTWNDDWEGAPELDDSSPACEGGASRVMITVTSSMVNVSVWTASVSTYDRPLSPEGLPLAASDVVVSWAVQFPSNTATPTATPATGGVVALSPAVSDRCLLQSGAVLDVLTPSRRISAPAAARGAPLNGTWRGRQCADGSSFSESGHHYGLWRLDTGALPEGATLEVNACRSATSGVSSALMVVGAGCPVGSSTPWRSFSCQALASREYAAPLLDLAAGPCDYRPLARVASWYVLLAHSSSLYTAPIPGVVISYAVASPTPTTTGTPSATTTGTPARTGTPSPTSSLTRGASPSPSPAWCPGELDSLSASRRVSRPALASGATLPPNYVGACRDWSWSMASYAQFDYASNGIFTVNTGPLPVGSDVVFHTCRSPPYAPADGWSTVYAQLTVSDHCGFREDASGYTCVTAGDTAATPFIGAPPLDPASPACDGLTGTFVRFQVGPETANVSTWQVMVTTYGNNAATDPATIVLSWAWLPPTPSVSPSRIVTPTASETGSGTASGTASITPLGTPWATDSPSRTRTASAAITLSPSVTPSATRAAGYAALPPCTTAQAQAADVSYLWSPMGWSACSLLTLSSNVSARPGCYPAMRVRRRSLQCAAYSPSSRILCGVGPAQCAAAVPIATTANCDAGDGGACCFPPCDSQLGEAPVPTPRVCPLPGSDAASQGGASLPAVPTCTLMGGPEPSTVSLLGGARVIVQVASSCSSGAGAASPLCRFGASSSGGPNVAEYRVTATAVSAPASGAAGWACVAPMSEAAGVVPLSLSFDGGSSWLQTGRITFAHPLRFALAGPATARLLKSPDSAHALQAGLRARLDTMLPHDDFAVVVPASPALQAALGAATAGSPSLPLRVSLSLWEVTDPDRPRVVTAHGMAQTTTSPSPAPGLQLYSAGASSSTATEIRPYDCGVVDFGDSNATGAGGLEPCMFLELAPPRPLTAAVTRPVIRPGGTQARAAHSVGAVRQWAVTVLATLHANGSVTVAGPLPAGLPALPSISVDGASASGSLSITRLSFPTLHLVDASLHVRLMFLEATISAGPSGVSAAQQTSTSPTFYAHSSAYSGGLPPAALCPVRPPPRPVALASPWGNASWGRVSAPGATGYMQGSLCDLLASLPPPTARWNPSAAQPQVMCPATAADAARYPHVWAPTPGCDGGNSSLSSPTGGVPSTSRYCVPVPAACGGHVSDATADSVERSANGSPIALKLASASQCFSSITCGDGPVAQCCYGGAEGGLLTRGLAAGRDAAFDPSTDPLRHELDAAWSARSGLCGIRVAVQPLPETCPERLSTVG